MSKVLAIQILCLLKENGFPAQKRELRARGGVLYSVYISGHNGLGKWYKEIGFCGEKNLKKYEKWKTFKYYDSNLFNHCRRSQAVRPEAATLSS